MKAIINGINAILDFFEMLADLVVTLFKSFFEFLDLLVTGTANFNEVISLMPSFIGAGLLVVLSVMTIKTIISMGGSSS